MLQEVGLSSNMADGVSPSDSNQSDSVLSSNSTEKVSYLCIRCDYHDLKGHLKVVCVDYFNENTYFTVNSIYSIV